MNPELHTLPAGRHHVACIMDGNGRWAESRDLPRTAGHTAGEENLASIVRASVQRDIGWLTVFGFSTENWVRPRAEVRHILGLHERLFGRIEELNENNVRIRWIGRPFDSAESRTPRFVQRAIRKAIAETAENTGLGLTVAFDYGSSCEMMDAARTAQLQGADIDIAAMTQRLHDPELPPVDVMIRTSGEIRVSNFLLWQAAGSAIYFTDTSWPDLSATELDTALSLVGAA